MEKQWESNSSVFTCLHAAIDSAQLDFHKVLVYSEKSFQDRMAQPRVQVFSTHLLMLYCSGIERESYLDLL
jgi:hypothetical protein